MLSPIIQNGYRLIDAGNGRKLEAVGPYVLDRPEPLAPGSTSLSSKEWKEKTNARYLEKGGQGEWQRLKEMPTEWYVELGTPKLNLKAHCSIEGSKQFGFFPEQSSNWEFLQERIPRMKKEASPRALMLFAHTGLASIVAKMAGADTFHVDSSKSSVTRARMNMEANGLDDIRWVVEDALKFVERERRRENRYQVIVMDPPSFGRGPGGELWKAKDMISELLGSCAEILDPDEQLMILNLYAQGASMKELGPGLRKFADDQGANSELEELRIPSSEGNGISAGATARIEKKGTLESSLD